MCYLNNNLNNNKYFWIENSGTLCLYTCNYVYVNVM